jgi:hypothetical protein
VVQQKVLESIDSKDLVVHVVWMPVLKNDSFEAAKKAPFLIPDARAFHYWDADQDLGRVYGRIVELPRGRELAWDIYFVFEPGVSWEDKPPAPTNWAHQLGIDERHLEDGDNLQEMVKALVSN